MFTGLAIFAVGLISITSILLVVNLNWRINVVVLAVQYLAAFYLFSLVFPLTLASVKLVVGWMSIAILGSVIPHTGDLRKTSINQAGRLFRLVTAVMGVVLAFSIAPFIYEIIPTGMVIIWAGLVMVIMGLLKLGMTTQPSQVIIGLLTTLCGFDIIYASVETSVLVVGLLALTTLGLALTGSYLINSADMIEEF